MVIVGDARLRVGFLCVVAVAGCMSSPVPVTYDGVAHLGGGIGIDTDDHRQGETSMGVAHFGIFTNIVTLFNDFSVSTASPLTDTTTFWDKGFSLLGWSTSSDFGVSWDYRGQVSPPTGWSELGADPSVAVDPNNGNIVYAVALAVSDGSWATIPGATAAVSPLYPVQFVDSFCVAQSIDGGQTFPTEAVHCRQVADFLSGRTTDRTAAVVDGLGRIWVAVADVPGADADRGTLRLFHSELGSPGTFTEEGPIPDGPYVRHQILRRDFDGNVWLGAMGDLSNPPSSAESGLHLIKYDISAHAFVLPGVTPDGGCGRSVSLVQDVFIIA